MKKTAVLFMCAAFLTGCGGGGGGDYAPPPVEIKLNRAEYSVAGSSGNKAMVTYENAQGGTSQELVTLPWTKSMFSASGNGLYVSAQSQSSIGSITVAVSINGKVVKSSSSNGPYVIATASATCC